MANLATPPKEATVTIDSGTAPPCGCVHTKRTREYARSNVCNRQGATVSANKNSVEPWHLSLQLPPAANEGDIPAAMWDLLAIAFRSYEIHIHQRSASQQLGSPRARRWSVAVHAPEFWQQDDISGTLTHVLRDFWGQRIDMEFIPVSEDRYVEYQLENQTGSPETTAETTATRHKSTTVQVFAPTADSMAALDGSLQRDDRDLVLVALHYDLNAPRYPASGTTANQPNLGESLGESIAASIHELIAPWSETERVQLASTSLRSTRKSLSVDNDLRDLVHLLVTITVALAVGCDEISMPQNGIDNLQLPVTVTGAAGRNGPSVSPAVADAFSHLITEIVGRPFTITNPLAFSTPAQVTASLLASAYANPLVTNSPLYRLLLGDDLRNPRSRLDRTLAVLEASRLTTALTERDRNRLWRRLIEPSNDGVVGAYVQHIRKLPGLPDEELSARLGTLPGVRWYARQGEYTRVKELLLRHTEETARILAEVVTDLADRLVRGSLPSSCFLLRALYPYDTDRFRQPTFRQAGQMWVLWYGGDDPIYLSKQQGIKYIHLLLQSPGRYYSALELKAAAENQPVLVSGSVSLIDRESLYAYKSHLKELHHRYQVANDNNDLGRMERVQQEIADVEVELNRTTGLGGRIRKRGDLEKARKAVSNAITRTLKKIASVHPDLARHLREALQLGAYLRYVPQEDIVWIT